MTIFAKGYMVTLSDESCDFLVFILDRVLKLVGSLAMARRCLFPMVMTQGGDNALAVVTNDTKMDGQIANGILCYAKRLFIQYQVKPCFN